MSKVVAPKISFLGDVTVEKRPGPHSSPTPSNHRGICMRKDEGVIRGGSGWCWLEEEPYRLFSCDVYALGLLPMC